ncbi:MAG: hypothetical protein A2788_02400 [Candidatus Abawacabacteria bacterium RIFCSPHIGHO2_01_FULL_46_8]|uniref:Solute-binding protein family 5 domain-containing protein n=1 Tax=Candidatus Abawacabacteria bacterium RIFCSPHIGHO2_01_FULL_46_8 TaxID=1817815 RepID=A0A1F4XHX9_9BACT|nr:MAG: hypothetical protein A2788_02400 [Candidatus Abawacabacteria bacterium RIFCSPHIGHO2_01_FULL_46_8]
MTPEQQNQPVESAGSPLEEAIKRQIKEGPKQQEAISLSQEAQASGQHSRRKKVLLGLCGLVFIVGIGLLFYEDISKLTQPQPLRPVSHRPLIAVTAIPVMSLDPTNHTAATKNGLINIFEGLIGLDENLKIIPQLATSWGNITPLIWEFKLRPNVSFHNGQPLTPQDIVFSFERAQRYQDSRLKSLLANIESVTAINTKLVQIKTKAADPVLINKILNVFIVPADSVANIETDPLTAKLVGTGPYEFVAWEPSKELRLKANANYWGEVPFLQEIVLISVPNEGDRNQLLSDGAIDLASDISAATFSTWPFPDYKLLTKPSSNLFFLMFNQEKIVDAQLRQAIMQALDKEQLVALAGELAHSANSFLTPYIFGFKPDIAPIEYNHEAAKRLIREIEAGGKEIPIDLELSGPNRILGQAVEKDLAAVGLKPKLNYLPANELVQKIQIGQTALYFLGWQFDSIDGADFLSDFFHSKAGGLGQYANYQNKEVDAALQKARTSFQEKERQQSLQTVLSIIRADLIGLPLFNTSSVYAIRPDLTWSPRIDGLLYFATLKPAS